MGAVWVVIVALGQTAEIQEVLGVQILFERGLNDRLAGRSPEAAAAFRQVAERLDGGLRSGIFRPSPVAYHWTGNSWFLAGDLPRAIVSYRRGLVVNPADERLLTALAYAREQVQYPPSPEMARLLRPEREWWPPWLSLRSFGGYAFGLYFVGCLAAMRSRMTRRRRWLVIVGAVLALAAVPAVGSGVEWWRERRDVAEPVVAAVRDVPLRAGNGSDYPAKLDLPRGCEVRRLFERGGWYQVETGGGAVGWVPADAVISAGRET
jgi:hypothetical protein